VDFGDPATDPITTRTTRTPTTPMIAVHTLWRAGQFLRGGCGGWPGPLGGGCQDGPPAPGGGSQIGWVSDMAIPPLSYRAVSQGAGGHGQGPVKPRRTSLPDIDVE
jgi:hypothetical protein